jgi:peptide/nickel transport system permease protein
VLFGARASLLVGGLVVGLGAGVGIPTGLIAGYSGGYVGAIIMRLYDVVLSFPAILLGLAVVSVLGPGTLNVSLAIAIALMPNFALLTRSSVLSEREKEYVQAARCVGSSGARIALRHIFPNCLAPLLVQFSLGMGFAVLAEATLSFLGLGTQPPQPSWGSMLSESRSFLRDSAWPGVWPGLALAILLISLNYLSDTLRDAFDPRTYR